MAAGLEPVKSRGVLECASECASASAPDAPTFLRARRCWWVYGRTVLVALSYPTSVGLQEHMSKIDLCASGDSPQNKSDDA